MHLFIFYTQSLPLTRQFADDLYCWPQTLTHIYIKGSEHEKFKDVRTCAETLQENSKKYGKNIRVSFVKRQQWEDGGGRKQWWDPLQRFQCGWRAPADTGSDMKRSGAKPGLESLRQAKWGRQRAGSPLTPQLCASVASCPMRTFSFSLDWNVFKPLSGSALKFKCLRWIYPVQIFKGFLL